MDQHAKTRSGAWHLRVAIFVAASYFLLLCAVTVAAQTSSENTSSPPVQQVDKPRESVIHGRVVRADNGKPVRRARVAISSGITSFEESMMTVTDLHGEFTVRNLAAGKYVCLIYASGLSNSNFDRQEPIELDGKNQVEITVTATRGAVISGRVRYSDREPVVRQQLLLFREQSENSIGEAAYDTWLTNDRGEYRIAGLPAGTYVVGLSELPTLQTRYGHDDRGGRTGMAAIFHPSAGNIKEARRITVVDGDEIQNINIDLATDDLFAIAGRVEWKGTEQPLKDIGLTVTRKDDPTPFQAGGTLFGLALAGDLAGDLRMQNQLTGYRADSNGKGGVTDSEGRWSITDLPPGTYIVEARGLLKPAEPTRAVYLLEDLPVDGFEEPPIVRRQLEVTVTDHDLSGLVIELSAGATISGMVTDEGAGAVAESVGVTAAVVGGNNAPVTSTDSKRDGTFALVGLPAGRLVLDASIKSSSGRYVRSMTLAGVDLLREPVTVPAGAQLSGAQIQLGADLARLSGTITGSDGRPAIGAMVLLAPVDRTRWGHGSAFYAMHGDVEGKFDLRVPPGQYLAFTWSAGMYQVGGVAEFASRHANEASQVTVQPNEQKQIELPVLIAEP